MDDIVFSLKDMLRNYFNINGRLPRAAYWWAYLGQFILLFSVANLIPIVGPVVSGLFALAFVVPLFTAMVRRCHDIGVSTGVAVGLFAAQVIVMLFRVGIVVTPIFSTILGPTNVLVSYVIVIFIVGLISLGIMIAQAIILSRPSKQESNEYGPYKTYEEYKRENTNKEITF